VAEVSLKRILKLTPLFLILLFLYLSNLLTFYCEYLKNLAWIFRFSSEETSSILIGETKNRDTTIIFLVSKRLGKHFLYLIEAETGSLIKIVDLGESPVDFLYADKFLQKNSPQLLLVCSSRWILLDFNCSKLADIEFLSFEKILEVNDYDKDGFKEILYCTYSPNIHNVYVGKYLLNQSGIMLVSRYLCSLEEKVISGALRTNHLILLSEFGNLYLMEFRGEEIFKSSILRENVIFASIKDIDCDFKEEIIVCKSNGAVEVLEITSYRMKWIRKFPVKTLLLQSVRFTSDDESTYGLLHSTGSLLHYACCVILLKSENGILYIINGNNGEILWYLNLKIYNIVGEVMVDTCDYNIDGTPDIFLGNKESVYVLDGRYGLFLKKINLNKRFLYLKAYDIDKDKVIEIIIGTCNDIFALKLR